MNCQLAHPSSARPWQLRQKCVYAGSALAFRMFCHFVAQSREYYGRREYAWHPTGQ